MKVVINKCFGGFGLSAKAIIELIGTDSKVLEVYEPAEYYGREFPEAYEQDLERSTDLGNGYREDYWVSTVYYQDKIYSYGRGDEFRSDPILVAVVERLGEEANTRHSKLKIVDIPDGVDFEIDEYDGMESIHERHRTWG